MPRTSPSTWLRRCAIIALSSALGATALPAAGAAAGATAATPAVEVREATNVRSIYTSEFGEARPAALTYSPEDGALFTADEIVDGTLNLVGVTTIEDSAGQVTATIPETTTTADTLAFDPLAGEFTAVSGDVLVSITPAGVVDRRNVSDLGLGAPGGATFDRAGRWYILDAATHAIVQLSSATDPAAVVNEIPIRGLTGVPLQGLAFNKADGLLYTMDPASKILYGIDKGGRVRRAWDLNARVRDPGSMVFAPSADNTDDPAETSLFLADSGSDAVLGQVLEVSLAAAVAAPVNQNATLVRTSNLHALNPPVPDSAGVTYIPAQNNMMVVDSEVEEMSIYNNANMWKTTLVGGLVQTGNTLAFSDEPTGVGLRTSNNQLYISDDDADRVFLDRPGPDGRWGNGDDLTGNVNTRNFGAQDAEGVAFNNVTNHYYVVDGVGNEVYDVAPGPNGRPGDGVAPQGDDVATHFDVGQFGAIDPEGIAVDEANNTIFVLDHKSETIYETSSTGTLLRTISVAAANSINAAGLEYAPASANANVRHFYLVDRGLDNDSNPSENDGKMYEMSVGSPPTNQPPVVTITSPTTGQTMSGTFTLTANATDDNAVTRVEFRRGTTLIGTDNSATGGWSVPFNTTTVPDGPITITATAFDAANLSGTHSVAANVDNDLPPTVSLTAPPNNGTVSGSVHVTANATDAQGVTQVQFRVGTNVIGTDTTAADGWSATWNTTSGFPDGPHTITATATDTANQTSTDSRNVTVDNTNDPPSVTITSPANNANVRGTITVQATANDDQGVTQVEFQVDGNSIGVDTTGGDGYTASWNTTTASNGPHTIQAIATAPGPQTATTSVNVTVDNGAPTVVITHPVGGTTVQNTISVDADANDATTSVSSVRFLVGSTTIGTDNDGSNGWSVPWDTTTVANGSRVLTAEATDAAGNTRTSDPVTVTVSNASAAVLNVPIVAGSDDAEQQASGAVDLGSSDIELVNDGSSNSQTVGLRFRNITVPAGATISNAYIQFQVDEATTATASLTVRGELSPNPSTYTTATNNVSSRPATAASVPWTPAGWPTVGARGPDQRTPEIKAIVQEIIGQAGWASGNAMAFKITGSGKRTAEAFESGAAIAASLHLEYTT